MKILSIFLLCIFSSEILANNSCIFEHPLYGVINLSSMGLRNGQPRFRDILPSSSSVDKYSFNPCYPFTQNNCHNAAVCHLSTDGRSSSTLGIQNISRWGFNSNHTAVLTYTYGDKVVDITMVCARVSPDELQIIGEDGVNHYSMRLRSRCACWNECGYPKTSTITPKTSTTTTTPAPYFNSCKYHDSRRGTIDLSSIGSIYGNATFKDVTSVYPSDFVWSYNPCYKFTEDSCYNVAGCQIDKVRHVSYTIGLQEYAYWTNMNTSTNLVPTIIYPSMINNRHLNVQLICDRSITYHRLQVIGEISVGEYVMQLTSPCACWDGCVKPSPDPEPISGDLWLIIGIVVGVFALLFLMMLTCLFCSKPKRHYPRLIINEKTPIVKGAYDYRS